MIKVSVLYPNGEGHTFDMAYYLDHHMPMVKNTLGTALTGMAVEEGLGGSEPGTPPAYLAMGPALVYMQVYAGGSGARRPPNHGSPRGRVGLDILTALATRR